MRTLDGSMSSFAYFDSPDLLQVPNAGLRVGNARKKTMNHNGLYQSLARLLRCSLGASCVSGFGVSHPSGVGSDVEKYDSGERLPS